MKKSKYYAPEIEEFHVGFEFEFRQMHYDFKGDVNEENVPDKTWVPDRITENDLKGNTDRNRNFGHNDWFNVFSFPIRVKYLDREDIESLGWRYIETCDFVKRDIYRKGELTLTHHPDGNCYLDIVEHYDKDSCEYGGICEDGWFRGTIKNKSELKRLFKQLKI